MHKDFESKIQSKANDYILCLGDLKIKLNISILSCNLAHIIIENIRDNIKQQIILSIIKF